MSQEALIINGVELSKAQSMTVRCALESFASDLAANGLGEDERGKSICQGYRDRIREIRTPLYKHVEKS